MEKLFGDIHAPNIASPSTTDSPSLLIVIRITPQQITDWTIKRNVHFPVQLSNRIQIL